LKRCIIMISWLLNNRKPPKNGIAYLWNNHSTIFVFWVSKDSKFVAKTELKIKYKCYFDEKMLTFHEFFHRQAVLMKIRPILTNWKDFSNCVMQDTAKWKM
jgi:hypothetical protein